MPGVNRRRTIAPGVPTPPLAAQDGYSGRHDADGGFMSEGQLLALTEDIYDAATGATPWSTVGQGLMRLVGAQSASVMVGDFTAGQMIGPHWVVRDES